MDFNIKYIDSIYIFGQEIWITSTIINTWIIGAILILASLIVRKKLKKFKEVPSGGQNIIEAIVEAMDNFVTSTMDEKYSHYGGWFFGTMIFILVSNLSGLIGLRPPTADISTTFALAFSTFFLIHFLGVKKSKGNYFKGYLEPMPAFLPLNIIGELSTPISLSFRLFGNILGGLIIMSMVYSLFPIYLTVGIPAVLHGYFDIFAGSLQSFIFVVLSMTFIRSKLPD